MTVQVEVRNLFKYYKHRAALRGVSFAVNKGDFFALVGPNGSGKSTILRLIDLLDAPTSGEIYFEGKPLDTFRKAKHLLRRKMGLVFQNTSLFNARVYDNVAYGLRARGETDISKRVSSMLELLGLEKLKYRKAVTLSGGEMQKVALAQALITEPELLMLDEPTSNLDLESAATVEDIISRFNRERGVTVILTTHNMFQAKRLAKQVAFILEGEVVETGDAPVFFSAPRDGRTKAFLEGKMAF